MSLKTAMEQSNLLTFAVLAILAWLVWTVLQVWESMNPLWTGTGEVLGQTAMGGVLGILVMLGLVVLFVVFFGQLGSASGSPSTWPPEE